MECCFNYLLLGGIEFTPVFHILITKDDRAGKKRKKKGNGNVEEEGKKGGNLDPYMGHIWRGESRASASQLCCLFG